MTATVHPLAAFTFEQTALLLAWLAILLLAFAMSGLVRLVHTLSEAVRGEPSRPRGPAIGALVPPIPDLNGAPRSVLLFVEGGCGACEQAIERMAAVAGRGSAGVAYAVLHRGDGPAPPSGAVSTVRHAGPVFDALGVTVTPTAVAVDDRRKVVASSLVGSPGLLDQFLQHVDPREGVAR